MSLTPQYVSSPKTASLHLNPVHLVWLCPLECHCCPHLQQLEVGSFGKYVQPKLTAEHWTPQKQGWPRGQSQDGRLNHLKHKGSPKEGQVEGNLAEYYHCLWRMNQQLLQEEQSHVSQNQACESLSWMRTQYLAVSLPHLGCKKWHTNAKQKYCTFQLLPCSTQAAPTMTFNLLTHYPGLILSMLTVLYRLCIC